MQSALSRDIILSKKTIEIAENEALLRFSGGDGRKLLNMLELVISASEADDNEKIILNNNLVTERLQENLAQYDKNGELHYDIISAFIKSIRGSDPNAAVYWLARMVEGGEDPKFIARRLLISASEDIGLANPNALLIATSCFQAVSMIGWPESRIILSETTIYLATSPKSNSAYMAIGEALQLVKDSGDLPVPLHLRNAPTKLMKEIGYGKDYKYAHSYENNFVDLEFLPEKLKGKKFYDPQNNPRENEIRARLKGLWKSKYGY
jgi:putative ATPase